MNFEKFTEWLADRQIERTCRDTGRKSTGDNVTHTCFGIIVANYKSSSICMQSLDNGLEVESMFATYRLIPAAGGNQCQDGLAVGYSIKKSKCNKATGVKTITDVKLHEVSFEQSEPVDGEDVNK